MFPEDIQIIIQWFTAGGKLTSTLSAAAIAALVRWVIIPIVKSIMDAKGKPLTAASIVVAVYASALSVSVLLGLIFREVNFTTAVAIGITAGLLALGLHQTGKVATEQPQTLTGVLMTAGESVKLSPASVEPGEYTGAIDPTTLKPYER